nr:sugar-binding domain-containing protein [uncultured Carboxylicivirga sp.]
MKPINMLLGTIFLVLNISCKKKFVDNNQPPGRTTKNFNFNWKFNKGDINNGESTELNDSLWLDIDLPHDWGIKESFSEEWASGTGYLPGGIGWYRKSFFVDKEEEGRKVFIYFGGISNNSTVWVNGNEVGYRPNGYVSFYYDISDYLDYGKDNLIAIKVNHSEFADSRWYTGSGIYRNVQLISTYPLYIKKWGVYAVANNVSKKHATVQVETNLINEFSKDFNVEIENYLLFGNDTIANNNQQVLIGSGEESIITQNIEADNPRLWSPETPDLYQLHTSIKKDGIELDKQVTTLGIRKIEYSADKGMFLNDHLIKLKGVCLHQDGGCLGVAVPDKVWAYRLNLLKEMGCNALRLAHNAFSSEFMDLCDQMGFLVIDEMYDEWELPKRKWVQGRNNGTPSLKGTSGYFNDWYEVDVTDQVLRNRNHPSIIMWSIGNEIEYPTDPYSHPILNSDENTIKWAHYNPQLPNATRLGKIARELSFCIKKLDASRPVTAGLALSVLATKIGYADALDVVGYNYQTGSYDSDHSKFPERIMYASEANMDYESWEYVVDHENFLGQFLWKGFDFIGEAYSFPSHSRPTGLIDLIGDVRSEYYYRKSLWCENPMVHLTTIKASDIKDDNFRNRAKYLPVWDYLPQDLINVYCYTNCKEVELFLNNHSLGKMTISKDDKNIAKWIIPFNAGRLKVVGKDKNGKVYIDYLQTPDTSSIKIIETSDCNALVANGKDYLQVYVSLSDKNNIPLTSKDINIVCTIDGPLQFVCMGDANTDNTEKYSDQSQSTYRGRLVAYFKSADRAGVAKINFKGEGFDAKAEMEINIIEQ